jgi:hypothetical protein
VCLDLIVREIKYFIAKLELKSSEKTKSSDWNLVKQELLAHKIDIQRKLCYIVSNKINEEFTKIMATDYNKVTEFPTEMVGSIKTTLMQLYNVLNKYLYTEDITQIYSYIYISLASKIRECSTIIPREKLAQDFKDIKDCVEALNLKENCDKVYDSIKLFKDVKS